jgi:hypothetical protein
MSTVMKYSVVPFNVEIDEENVQQFEKRKALFFKVISFKINSLPIKKHIIDILREHEGPMFSELCCNAVLNDIRVYARYATIAVKGYNEKNDTLYVFKNKNATSDKILYITIHEEQESECEAQTSSEIVCNNMFSINNDVLHVLRLFCLGYICMGVLIGFNYLSKIN